MFVGSVQLMVYVNIDVIMVCCEYSNAIATTTNTSNNDHQVCLCARTPGDNCFNVTNFTNAELCGSSILTDYRLVCNVRVGHL